MPEVIFGQPLSRSEAILQNMLGANNVLEPPMSREEYLLLQLLDHIGPSGDYYTKEEIDNMISAIEQEIDWKESVATFADLATTYPDAEAGWTSTVLDVGRIYRYNGTDWIDIYGMIPLATSSVNGLMSTGKVIDLETVKTLLSGHSVGKDVPSDAKFTDTVYDDTALSGRVTVVEGLLDSHSVGKDVPSDAQFTDTVYDDTALSGRVTTVEGLLDGHSVGKDVPSDAEFTDTVYDDTELRNRVTELENDTVSKAATGNPINITDTADAPIVSGEITFEPKQDLHGYDKPWAGGAGKNQLPMTVDGIKALNTSGTWSGNVYSADDVTFTIVTDTDGNVTGIKTNGTATNVIYFIISNSFVGDADLYSWLAQSGDYRISSGVTGDSQTTYGVFYRISDNITILAIRSGVTVSNLTFYPMIRLATDTDPTFAPYSNVCPISGYTEARAEVTDDATSPTVTNTYTIDLDGTRYGGKVNMVSGEMRVDRAIVDLGTLDWSYDSSILRFDSYVTGIKEYSAVRTNPFICSIYQTISDGRALANVPDSSIYNGAQENIHVKDLHYNDAATFKTAMSGQTLCYELATPFTVQLTPEQIRTLEGTNNISTNMTSMSLEYITQDYQPLVDLADDTALSGRVTAVEGLLDSHSIASDVPADAVFTDTVYDDTAISNRVTALESKSTKVYAMHIDGTESDPANMITYLLDAVGMTPAYMDYANNSFNYGSWGDTWLVKDVKPCILNKDGTVYAYLNKNDFTKDINGTDVTALIDGTTDNGQNVMIEFPKIWMKIVPDADDKSGTVYFSPIKLDDDYKDYPYIDYQGNHKEHFYMPAYNGSVVNDGTNNVMRSLSNKQVSNTLTAATEIQYCQNNGDGYNTEDAGEVMLINFLLMLIGKSTDTQAVFGKGLSESGSETINNAFRTGVQNDKGMFYGTNSGAASTYTNAVKVFGIENWYGFQWRRYAGDINASGMRKIKLCYGTEDGSTVNDYNTDGSGYVNVGATPSGTSGGYISEMKFTEMGMFSKVSSGSSSTYYCDGQWYNNNQTDYAFRGGSSDYGARVGAFFVALYYTPSGAGWDAGAALSYK